MAGYREPADAHPQSETSIDWVVAIRASKRIKEAKDFPWLQNFPASNKKVESSVCLYICDRLLEGCLVDRLIDGTEYQRRSADLERKSLGVAKDKQKQRRKWEGWTHRLSKCYLYRYTDIREAFFWQKMEDTHPYNWMKSCEWRGWTNVRELLAAMPLNLGYRYPGNASSRNGRKIQVVPYLVEHGPNRSWKKLSTYWTSYKKAGGLMKWTNLQIVSWLPP